MGPGQETSIFNVLLGYFVFAIPVILVLIIHHRNAYKNFSDKITFGEYMHGAHFYRFLANNHGPSAKKLEQLEKQRKEMEFKALQQEFEKYRVKS